MPSIPPPDRGQTGTRDSPTPNRAEAHAHAKAYQTAGREEFGAPPRCSLAVNSLVGATEKTDQQSGSITLAVSRPLPAVEDIPVARVKARRDRFS